MKTFRASDGREWAVQIDGDAIVRVKDACGILLTDLISGAVAQQLAEDPIKVMAVLFAVCRIEADERKIDEVGFRRLLSGDALEAATDALIDGVIDFFPKSRREMARKLMSKGRELSDLATRRAIEEIDRTSADSLLARLPGDGSGNVQASPASTPAG